MNRTHLFALTISFIILVLGFTGCDLSKGIDQLPFRKKAKEDRCKLTLRAFGETQIAFSDGNNGDYGTWEELVKADFIQEGYTVSNIIDYYHIPVFNCEKAIRDDDGEIIEESAFTIVAVPNSKKFHLRTFALDENQTPLVWYGSKEEFNIEEIDLNDISVWRSLGRIRTQRRR